ncbi:protein translocase subunit SecD [Methylophaga pinxianii]|uniref:protein translocase subunit SecD n=1 Tax=Methylophaga pinxianii TaxID=2881052 RepID=UPI001CF21463|nr:protein translocase subunit SecD [Methylophaga pinxianii]MCB2427584.1 protein translocase subunit SecD [Methylophaga pinxianii]UPH44586.1 protein translocase subunit SecD [Methylophaga pinxianii]
MRSFYSRAVVFSLIIILGLLSALPNVLPASTAQHLPSWFTDNTFKLGLDLSGGSHLLMQVDIDDLRLNNHQQLAEQIKDALREKRIFIQPIAVSKNQLVITPKDTNRLDEIQQIVRSFVKDPKGGLALFSLEDDSARLTITPTKAHSEKLTKDAVEHSLKVVRQRLNESGLVDPTITKQGSDGILVQLPGVDDPSYIRSLLGTTAKMTFHWAANADSKEVIQAKGFDTEEVYALEARVVLEGKHIQDANLVFSQESGQPVVSFVLDKEGARLFTEMTQNNIGRSLAIVLDDEVITAPVIRSVIAGGRGEISGAFTVAEANELALLLRAGALPAPLNVIEERTVGPDLGSDSISMGITTGIIGALLVLLFMLAIYGSWGLIASLSLTLNIGLIFGVLSLLGATLTLPGIAGIILSIGMAVDANILINERIREETRRGKRAFIALDAGFKRAYSTILDSNITSLIAISLLFMFGSGPVRGFAVAMAIGLITSMFTSISFTRLLMEWRISKMPKQALLEISGIKSLDRLSNSKIDFMRGRFIGITASAILSLASIGLFFQPGLHYGIDFSGGTVMEIAAPDTDVEQLRQALQDKGFSQAAIQEFGDDDYYLVRLPMEGAEQVASGKTVDEIKSAVTEISAQASFPRVELVGPKVSSDFRDATILAIVFAGFGMLAYLWIRFEYHFALAATLTIGLDLTKTIGFFVLAGVEFNLTAVAALLALIGYSVNDKVVVFDRVRENLRLTPDKPMLELLNESITSTLTRTVFTSVTTFLALIPMAVAGGSAVASFALPMLFGIVIGTSSSVFIAAPIVYWMGQHRLRKGLPQLRPSAEEMQKKLDAIM